MGFEQNHSLILMVTRNEIFFILGVSYLQSGGRGVNNVSIAVGIVLELFLLS